MLVGSNVEALINHADIPVSEYRLSIGITGDLKYTTHEKDIIPH